MALNDYIDIINPKTVKETAERIAKVDDQKMTFIHIVTAELIGIIALALSTTLATLTGHGTAQMPQGDSGAYNTYLAQLVQLQQSMLTPLGIGVTFITGVLMFYIGLALLHQICRALGGNGNLGNLFYAISLASLSYMAINSVITIMNVIPVLSCFSMLAGLLIGAYIWYVEYKIVRAVHTSLDRAKAIIALVLYMVAMFILAMLVFAGRFVIGM